MNFEKFNLTEISHEEVSLLGGGVEIWEREGMGCELEVVTMHKGSGSLVLTAWFEDEENDGRTHSKRWLMTLK
jgi:3-mercaptopyruvate sulfurtransferase SseA